MLRNHLHRSVFCWVFACVWEKCEVKIKLRVRMHWMRELMNTGALSFVSYRSSSEANYAKFFIVVAREIQHNDRIWNAEKIMEQTERKQSDYCKWGWRARARALWSCAFLVECSLRWPEWPSSAQKWWMDFWGIAFWHVALLKSELPIWKGNTLFAWALMGWELNGVECKRTE